MAIKDIVNQPLNVKNLETDFQVHNEVPFDPERDIPHSEKAKIKKGLSEGKWILMGPPAILFPDVLSPSNPKTSQAFASFEERAKSTLETLTGRLGHDYLVLLSDAKIAFPRHYQSIDPDLPSHEWGFVEMMSRVAASIRLGSKETIMDFALYGVPVAILYPRRIPEILKDVWDEKSERELRNLVNEINNLASENANVVDSGSITQKVEQLADVALLFPESRKLFKDKLDWQMLKRIRIGRNNILYKSLLILSVEKAEITDEGIKLTFPEPPTESPLPEERSF